MSRYEFVWWVKFVITGLIITIVTIVLLVILGQALEDGIISFIKKVKAAVTE